MDQENTLTEPTLTTAPVEQVLPKISSMKAECTRDTRGDNPCDVKDCENCN